MYFDGGMEKISEPKFILRGGKEDTILELKERELLMALLSNDILPLYASFMSKIVLKGRPMVRKPVSVRACVGVVKVTVPKLKDETLNSQW